MVQVATRVEIINKMRKTRCTSILFVGDDGTIWCWFVLSDLISQTNRDTAEKQAKNECGDNSESMRVTAATTWSPVFEIARVLLASSNQTPKSLAETKWQILQSQ